MTVTYQKGTANYVPAAAVIRRSRALSGFIGRKASAGGLISLKLKSRALSGFIGRKASAGGLISLKLKAVA